MLWWRGQKDECVRCCCLFLHHTLCGISGRKPHFTALNVECVYCMQSPRRSGATVICLCSMLMSRYISEQRWMQLIDCDAAINYSCNRSVMESNPSTDRHRLMFKGCRHSCLFFSHSGNAFISTITFTFPLLHVRTLLSPMPHLLHASPLPTLLLSLNRRLRSPLTSKGADQSAGLSVFPADGCCSRTDWMMSVFVPRHGNKIWHISSSCCAPRMPLYEITVLTGQIVVYVQALEFQQIMEGVLFTEAGQKIIGEWWSLHSDYSHAWNIWGAYVALFTPPFERCWCLMLPR